MKSKSKLTWLFGLAVGATLMAAPVKAMADWDDFHRGNAWGWRRHHYNNNWWRGERHPDADDWLANGVPNPNGDYWQAHPHRYQRYLRNRGYYGYNYPYNNYYQYNANPFATPYGYNYGYRPYSYGYQPGLSSFFGF